MRVTEKPGLSYLMQQLQNWLLPGGFGILLEEFKDLELTRVRSL